MPKWSTGVEFMESAVNVRNWGVHLEARRLECGGEIELMRRGAMVF